VEDDPMARLLATYPRARPALGPLHRAVYERELLINRTGGSLTNRLTIALEGWMHRAAAARATPGSVLEIGAGTLNHLPYESPAEYDAVEPNKRLWAGSPRLGRVRAMYESLAAVPEGSAYDRVLSIAVLEHLDALPEVVARAALLLKPGGRFQAGIPSEGGFLWGAAWRLTTGIGYRLRNGLPYGPLMRYEHLNDAPDILAVLRWFFGRVEVRRFPLPLHHLSFYAYVEASAPDVERCRAYLAGLPKAAA
jgi:SAM-dependent methyltransferase